MILRLALAFVFFVFNLGWASQVDFDVAIVGTSPVSMLEALYRIARQEKVLIIEADQKCGGAWKSVDLCGISQADLGCHLLGSDLKLKEFLERYIGCHFVCMEHPLQAADANHRNCNNGYYFSRGCQELITRLETLIHSAPNAVLAHTELQSIYVDTMRQWVELDLKGTRYTAGRLIITSGSKFKVSNPGFNNQEPGKSPHMHLYLLIEDGAPSRFTYLNGVVPGMSRAMNLTPFLSLPNNHLQFIVIQTFGKNELGEEVKFVNALKMQGFLSQNAQIVASDTCVYDQIHMNSINLQRLGGTLIEVLNSASFWGMSTYVDRWKSAMMPIY